MNGQNLPKFPWCDSRTSDKQRQKEHLLKEHRPKLIEIAKQYNQIINWAVGELAFLFDK
jgi:hypothetical protein